MTKIDDPTMTTLRMTDTHAGSYIDAYQPPSVIRQLAWLCIDSRRYELDGAADVRAAVTLVPGAVYWLAHVRVRTPHQPEHVRDRATLLRFAATDDPRTIAARHLTRWEAMAAVRDLVHHIEPNCVGPYTLP